MINAKNVYQRQLQSAFAKEDYEMTALAVQLADEAGVHQDERVTWWLQVKRSLHDAAIDPEKQSVYSLLNVVQPAHDFPLPRTDELRKVEAVAQELTTASLKSSLADGGL